MATRAKSKPKSAKPRHQYAGKRVVTLGLTPEQHDLLRKAADSEDRPLTQFITRSAVAVAMAKLGEKSEK